MKKLFLFLFMLSISIFQYAHAQTISGIVTDASDGLGIPGVNIQVKGTTVGTITDMDGKYTIEVSGEAPVLLFSFIGYKSKEVAVGTQTTIDVKLDIETTGLDEVVVIGYGVQKKSLVTGAIAKVDGEELTRGSGGRITQAMQGKTAGVVIASNSGQPGEFVSVRIRGTGTNGDAEPLYIIDGLPNNGHGIDYLNAEDIESIEVLKDAAASAIYGARAANGVVLITTKQGKKNSKTEVSYSGYYGVQNPWRKMGTLEKDDYVMIMNEAATNAGQAPVFDQTMIDTLGNTDWQDEMFYRNAPKMSHTISLTGGGEKLTYSSSLSYFVHDGIVAKGKSNFERINYRLNTIGDFGFLELGSTINYSNINTKGIAANDKYSGSSLIQALNAPPIVPIYMADGSYGTPEKFGIGMQEITNPIAMLNYSNSSTKTNKIIAGLYAEFDFGKLSEKLKGLKFKSRFGSEFVIVTENGYTPIYSLDATHISTINSVNKKMHQYNRWNFENYITYSKTFGEHSISALIGHTAFREWDEDLGGKKSDVIFDEFDKAYLNNATDPESASIYGGFNDHTMLSYFGRVNYNLKEKYMLTAILRADGSSRFGSENKFGFFPSVSVGWILSQENFMSFLEPIANYAKIRASWGQNGNENIGNFRYTTTMSTGAIYYFGADKTQYNGMQPTGYSNPLLKWETSEQINVGLDLQFLQNMFSLTADYYIKNTRDWLVEPPVRPIAGNSPPTVNGGDIRNSGIEFEIGYRQNFGEFKVNISFTSAYNKNEVIDIPNAEERLLGGSGGHGQTNILAGIPGEPMGHFYGIKTDGIFQTLADVNAHVDASDDLIQPNAVPGDIKFIDKNGDGIIDEGDRENLGNPFPDFTGGLNINLEWKGIDFNMSWYTAIGHQIWNGTYRYDLLYSNYTYEVLNRWTGPNTTNENPRVTLTDANNNWSTASDFFVKDADFLRLKTISLGYTIPSDLLKVAKISNLRVYVAADNLLTFTKYNGFDPEIGGDVFGNGIDLGIYPQARTFIGGINITF